MTCSNCGKDNREDAKFCDSCGTRLTAICPSCNTELRTGARFCDSCGSTVSNPIPDHHAPLSSSTTEQQTDVTAVVERDGDNTISSDPSPPLLTEGTPAEDVTDTEEPLTFSDGRYEIAKFLGEGGKKKVYLAKDSLLDRDVAFALIKTEGLDEVGLTRVNREAQAMGRLGSHPHIVTVFDLGQQDGQPFMVTELMGGGDVEGLVEDSPENRVPMDQTMDIGRSVCRGLEFAHSKNIVHRDLKPGNVWMTSDGVAKIGDFGLAVATDRSRLTQHGMMVGTVSYMPPEQAMGGEVTEKSDLYSLGAMMYEMVTGRPPFLGDDAIAIIGQHINTPPVAPSWHNSACPKPLEALIMRLLAKDPADRPESATDVLSAFGAMDLTSPPEPAAQDSPDRSLDSISTGVFVGRQTEMDDLKAALEESLSGKGRMITLVGEPGIGKTRTSQELATYATLRNAQVLWGRCYEEQGVPPYWPWVQAIRSYVRERDPQDLSVEMGAGASDIAEIVSDVRERLPGLPNSSSLDADEARFRLFDSITSFLKSASQRQPIVLILDDLHWSDKPSLSLLQFVARELAGTRLLLVGTYRDMELSRQHPLAESLAELTRERLFQRILLRGLDRKDVGRFIEVATGIGPPDGLVTAVYTQTEGNPLFVTEIVRLLVQEGDLTADRSTGGDSWTVRIPEGVREVIGRRLNRLSERCNETLTVASILGREFRFDQLKSLVEDISEDRLLDVLDEALGARVIEEMPSVVGQYQFTHALMQETLVEEISLTRRVRLHSRIATALEELYGSDSEAHAAELAHHFAQAEAVLGPDKLVRYSSIAGFRALGDYAFEEAFDYFERALAGKGVSSSGTEISPDEESAALLFGLGQALSGNTDRIGESATIDIFSRSFHYYVEAGEIEKAAEIAGFGHGNLGYELISEALELVPPDSYEAGKLFARAVMPLRNEYEQAQHAIEQAIAIARREDDVELEMKTLVSAACIDFSYRKYPESLERNYRALELSKVVNQLVAESHLRYDLMHVNYGLGNLDEAALHAEAMVEVSKRSGQRRWQASALEISENISTAKGDWITSRELTDRGLESIPRDGNLLGSRTIVEYQTGQFETGSTYLERLITVTRSMPMQTQYNAIPGWYAVAGVTIPMVGKITGNTEHFNFAKEVAQNVLKSSVVPGFVVAAYVGQALMAVQLNEVDNAKDLYTKLEGTAGTIAPTSPNGPGIATYRLLGLLAQTLGDLTTAIENFDKAVEFCREGGFLPELAWTLSDYADAVGNRNQPQDTGRSSALFEESLEIASRLEMRPLMQHVLSRREILKA
tara:strand:- start:219 stop:4145 length:3927 start_codon:yes stop_codon:yes gene_type:complete